MKYIFILLMIIAPAFQSVADDNTAVGKITKIATDWGQTGTYFSVTNIITLEGCNEADKRVVVPLSNPMHDQIFSLATAAFLANKDVVFRVSGCTSNNLMKGIAITIQ